LPNCIGSYLFLFSFLFHLILFLRRCLSEGEGETSSVDEDCTSSDQHSLISSDSFGEAEKDEEKKACVSFTSSSSSSGVAENDEGTTKEMIPSLEIEAESPSIPPSAQQEKIEQEEEENSSSFKYQDDTKCQDSDEGSRFGGASSFLEVTSSAPSFVEEGGEQEDFSYDNGGEVEEEEKTSSSTCLAPEEGEEETTCLFSSSTTPSPWESHPNKQRFVIVFGKDAAASSSSNSSYPGISSYVPVPSLSQGQVLSLGSSTSTDDSRKSSESSSRDTERLRKARTRNVDSSMAHTTLIPSEARQRFFSKVTGTSSSTCSCSDSSFFRSSSFLP
jgi:hypothetical protein